jgi:hypothetical protein
MESKVSIDEGGDDTTVPEEESIRAMIVSTMGESVVEEP